MIKNNEDGFICELKKEFWIECIKKVLLDDKYRKEISIKAKEKIQNNYIWDSLSSKFIDVYKEVIKKF